MNWQEYPQLVKNKLEPQLACMEPKSLVIHAVVKFIIESCTHRLSSHCKNWLCWNSLRD